MTIYRQHTNGLVGKVTVLENENVASLLTVLRSGILGGGVNLQLAESFNFEQTLDLSAYSNVTFIQNGCRISSTMAPAVGLADSPTNCLIKARAVESTASTLTAIAKPGVYTLTVASTSGWAAGNFLRIYSYDGSDRPSNYLVSNEDIPAYRVYQIATVDSATQVTLTSPVRYWHANGGTVTKITPPQNLAWLGGMFDCAGGSIANAILLDGVQNAFFEDVLFRGFSRAGLELNGGTRSTQIRHCGHMGQINSVLYLKTCEDTQITDFTSPAQSTQTKHANGVPRALINCRTRAANTTIKNARFAYGSIGLRIWAVEGLIGDGLTFESLDGRNISGEGRGVCIDGGQAGVTPDLANEVDGASFSVGVELNNISISNVFGTATQCMIYYHDMIGPVMRNVQVRHHGVGDGGTGIGPVITPIVISDCPGGQIDGVYCTGTYGCIATENGAANNGIISNIYLEASAGSLYSLQAMFAFNHVATGPMTIRDVKISNGGIYWSFGASFDDPYTMIYNFQGDGWKQPASRLKIVVNATARPANEGQIFQLTTALGGTGNKYQLITTPTAGAQQNCVACCTGAGVQFETGVNGGFGFVQELGMGLMSNVRVANHVGTGPVLLQGDIVRHCSAGDGGVGNARGDNTATYATALGQVYGAIAADAATALTRLR